MRPSTRKLRFGSVLTVLFLAVSAVAIILVVPSQTLVAAGGSDGRLISDDFTHDAGLNASLWQINGPVGSAFGPHDVGTGATIIALAPGFSSEGMRIAQVNASFEVGTIQSVMSFAPPFTADAVVRGTVSNGHTFAFAITTGSASSGVLIIGNLNPTDCSALGNCGDPATCGTPANSAIPPNQCYYGAYAKVGNGTGGWKKVEPKLYSTPMVNVTYSLRISVAASGIAQYSISDGGSLLGQATAQVGTGPFFIILEQGEGAPVAHPGPNQAYWMSALVSSGSAFTTSSTTSTGPAPASSGFPTFVWVIVILVVLVLLIIVFFLFGRRRGFTVSVEDSDKRSPIFEATVSAEGPESLTGVTNRDGKVKFGSVKEGDYSVRAVASGYAPSASVTVQVKRRTEYTVRLGPILTGPQGGPSGGATPEGGGAGGETTPHIRQPQPPTLPPSGQSASQQPVESGAAPTSRLPDLDGFGLLGGRVQEIINTFQAKGAVSPETAMTAEELGLSRLFVRIMKRRKGRTKVFIETNGKYYLNKSALKEES